MEDASQYVNLAPCNPATPYKWSHYQNLAGRHPSQILNINIQSYSHRRQRL